MVGQMGLRFSLASVILGLRLMFIVGGEGWNSDIPNAILPGLHCWYCVPYQAPYGLLWYLADFPFSFLGPGFYIGSVFTVDALVYHKIHNWNGSWLYAICSFWIGLQAPYDISVLWFTLLGLYRWPLVFLGPLAKLPDNLASWQFLLSKPYLASDFQYYALMGIVFLSVLVSKRKNIAKTGQTLYMWTAHRAVHALPHR
jgi:hypothetical protein